MRNAKCKIADITTLRLLLNCLVFLACLTASFADAEEGERDPFFPADRLTTGPAPTVVRDEWGRDPFDNPFGGARSGAPRQQGASAGGALTGIIYSPDARFAIIGSEVLRVGGKVGNRTITDIRRNKIVLKDPSGFTEEMVLDDFAAGK